MWFFYILNILLLPLAAQCEVTCSDSPLKFAINGKYHSCAWVRHNIAVRCLKEGVARHCPSACRTCVTQACKDSTKAFKIVSSEFKGMTCDLIAQAENKEQICTIEGVTDTCRNTCRYCESMNFNRISTFPICSQIEANCDTNIETVAEIVVASDDGMTLIYSDSQQKNVGFVDVTDAHSPKALGVTMLTGEPTSVAVLGDYAFAAINTSEDFVNPSGKLVAINIKTKNIEKTWELGGQPDSVAISPDQKYIVIAIENERDEDLGDGSPPQMPAGFVLVFETTTELDDYSITKIDLIGLDGVKYPEDPEPEFVSINNNNIATVTLQENNAIVLIDLADKNILSSFSAGFVDLNNIDTVEEDVIDQSSSLFGVPREPDGVVFIDDEYFATADEGDLDGGSRGFTIFDMNGEVRYSSGSEMDQIAAAVGHYPENRSENKGNEPENVASGSYGGVDHLFVNSERSGLVFVYDITNISKPVFKQVLPCNVAPEGSKAISSRGLLAVANERDARGDKIRSTITIYEFSESEAQYPTLISRRDETTGVAIPWGALSGLTPDPSISDFLYSVEDNYYNSNRFFTINVSNTPAIITKATRIMDINGFLAAKDATLVNDDKSVNIDPEGIAADGKGNLYIVSEGVGTIDDKDDPFENLNYIIKVNMAGDILDVIELPKEFNDKQRRFGLEGIAYHPDGILVACLQRAWNGQAGPAIFLYNLNTSEFLGYVIYPLDKPTSQDGGWVGISDVTYSGSGMIFYVLERDNKGGPDAAVKKITEIDLDLASYSGQSITKMDVSNLLDIYDSVGGLTIEKIEGLASTENGIWIINDNDGVDDNSGETQLLKLNAFTH